MTEKDAKCIYCERDSVQIPLLSLRFRDGDVWICPQHLPILIHEPGKLAGKLPGAEDMQPAAGHDHH
jgi:hypothetical protein